MNSENQPTNQATLRTIESVDFNNIKERINSPRSLEALGILGINQHKLYYVSFDDYNYMHPELKQVAFDLKNRRFQNFEQKRLNRIEQIKNKRNELIELTLTKAAKSKSSSQSSAEVTSTIIQNEREKLNLLRKQQIGELKNIIEFEFKMEEIRSKNEYKMQQKEKRDEEIRLLRIEQSNEKKLKQKAEELKREELMKQEIEEQERKMKERQEEERRAMFEELKRREIIEKEKQKRIIESSLRQEEFKKKIDDIIINQQNELMEKQRELFAKDEQRRKNILQLKKENYLSSLSKQKKKKDRAEKALCKNDSTFMNKQTDFEKKQKIAEAIRRRFALERQEKQKQADLAQKQKELDIIELLKKNEDKIQERMNIYHKKQQQLTERQREREIIIEREMKEKRIALLERERRYDEARKRNETMIEDNRKKIIEKINSVERKIKRQRDDNYRTSLEKFIEFSIRKENIEDNIQQRESAMEYQRIQRILELENKNKRVEEMRIQKLEIAEEKKKMNIELQRSKENMMKKFETLRKSKRITDKNELFSELFDDYSNQNSNPNSNSNTNLLHSKSTRQFSPQVQTYNKIMNPKEDNGNTGSNSNNNQQSDFQFLTNLNPNNNDDKKTLEDMMSNNNNNQSDA